MIPAEDISFDDFKGRYFEQYKQLLINEFGFYIGENRIKDLQQVLLKYLKKSSYENYDDFYQYITSTIPGRILSKQMIEDITIGETYFFRNQPQLEVLEEHILQELLNNKKSSGDNTIKIWSAGCSTGEEPYSLAILILEHIPNPNNWQIQIVGTDINRVSINTAQTGIYYGSRPRQHIPENILNKYFSVKGDQFIVNDNVRKLIKFQQHNLIKDLPPIENPDIIFCRNVTIYFNIDTTRDVVNNFYKILKDKGYLFLGHSETIWQICDKFQTRDFPKGFVYQKNLFSPGNRNEYKASAIIPEFNLDHIPSKEKKTSGFSLRASSFEIEDDITDYSSLDLESAMAIDIKYHQGVLAFEKKDYLSALNIFNQIIEKDKNYMLAHFAKATLLSNQGKYEDAIKSLNFLIEKDNLFLEAYFLKSILHMKLHETTNAINTFQKVIYIDPDNALSYFHLINLYKESTQPSQAALACKNIKRVCDSKTEDEIVPFSDSLTYSTLGIIADKVLTDLT